MKSVYSILRSGARDIVLRIGGVFAKPSKGIHIITGHMSHKSKPSLQYMENTMAELSKTVKFIRIEDAVRMIEKHEEPDEPLCAFTFDDGFAECYDCIAPVLERYGVNAAFFVNPNFVEGNDNYIRHFTEETVATPGKKPMRWNQLIDLHNRGFIIGAHTMDHYRTSLENLEALDYQIVRCKEVIEEHLGCNCDFFAWPYGRMDSTSNKAVKIACNTYKYVFSQTDYRHYFSFNGQVINRRHFEPFWPISHIKFFLSKSIRY